MQSLTWSLFALALVVAMPSFATTRTCRGTLNLAGHPEWSGYYVGTIDKRVGFITLSNAAGHQQFTLPQCAFGPLGGSCREAELVSYVLGFGDTPGMSVGVDTGAGYVSVGFLRDCVYHP